MKCKIESSKFRQEFKLKNLEVEESHPIRDLDTGFIVNKLESEIKKRDSLLGKLKK